MTRLHALPVLPSHPAPHRQTARKAHPIAPELVDPTPTPVSTDTSPRAEGTHPDGGDLPTQLAIGSDGRLYITAEALPESIRRGRRQFIGVALTAEEATFATKHVEVASIEVAQSVWRMLVRSNPGQ